MRVGIGVLVGVAVDVEVGEGVGVEVGEGVGVEVGEGVSVEVGGSGVGLGGGVHAQRPIDSVSKNSHVVALIMATVNLGYVEFVSRRGVIIFLCRTTSFGSGRSQIASSAGRDTTQLCRVRSLGLKCITAMGVSQGEARRECRKRLWRWLNCADGAS
ncbi:MAG: hypothetical protein L6435_06070 [Anaerolineae bacterium]|nr:hypothetical protein [Anaerolineae bacterium]